jgi:lipoate-protein ligase A
VALTAVQWEVVRPKPLPAQVQMALEEVLLQRLDGGRRGPTLRFWEWQDRALVLGSNQVLANEVDVEAAAELGFQLARRMSGGGTMIVEPAGTISYSLYAPRTLVAGMTFVESFAFFDGWAVECLRGLGVPAEYRPINDIVSPRGKIGGAAQARRRGAVLHHTTIAFDIDAGLVTRLIRIGRDRVSPRGVRSAEKPVSPLSWFLDLTREAVVEALISCFLARFPARVGPLTADELDAARDLADRKYAKPDWIDRL